MEWNLSKCFQFLINHTANKPFNVFDLYTSDKLIQNLTNGQTSSKYTQNTKSIMRA